jgi:hypothetical protein
MPPSPVAVKADRDIEAPNARPVLPGLLIRIRGWRNVDRPTSGVGAVIEVGREKCLAPRSSRAKKQYRGEMTQKQFLK